MFVCTTRLSTEPDCQKICDILALLPMNVNVKVVATVVVLMGAIFGYLFGFRMGKNIVGAEASASITKLQSVLDIFVPPLPDVVNVIGGRIIAVDEGLFTIEIPSLTDRYPKPDTPMATETKTVWITEDTKITSINFDQKTFKSGAPQQKEISPTDLGVGDTVSVTVTGNARTEQNLTAVSISRSSGI